MGKTDQQFHDTQVGMVRKIPSDLLCLSGDEYSLWRSLCKWKHYLCVPVCFSGLFTLACIEKPDGHFPVFSGPLGRVHHVCVSFSIRVRSDISHYCV